MQMGSSLDGFSCVNLECRSDTSVEEVYEFTLMSEDWVVRGSLKSVLARVDTYELELFYWKRMLFCALESC